jgi:hypothetical protein
MANGDLLRTEKDYLMSRQEELAKTYPGKYLVIHGEEVVGAYDTYEDGVRAGTEFCGAGPFLVRSVHRAGEEETLTVPVLALGLF